MEYSKYHDNLEQPRIGEVTPGHQIYNPMCMCAQCVAHVRVCNVQQMYVWVIVGSP